MRKGVSKPRFGRCLIASMVILTLIICGCTDLKEITQFAKASQDVGKAFPGIAADAQASCNGANNFINAQNNVPPLDCEIYSALGPSLKKVNDALFDYIASLGNLASADLSKTAGGFDSLSADLKQADPSISTENQSKASAAGGLAKAITNLWANGYRLRELSKIIRDNNQAVQNVTQFLSQYATDKYRQSLADEWRYESSYCTSWSNTSDSLALDLLAKKCKADRDRIDQQLTAIKSYQGALAIIGATHQKLYEERSHWDAKELSKDLAPGIVSLGTAAVSVNKAF